LPYADVEKRRKFQRRYKKAWRRRQAAKVNPLRAVKIYVCPRFPFLRVGRAQFDGGFLITDRFEVQVEVEQHPEFGKFIFPIALDLDLVSPLIANGADE
jgi:hypothetical protein